MNTGAIMAEQEDIERQLKLLKTHRETLSHYLYQQATFGTAYLPPNIAQSIRESRAQIRRIKDTLNSWGVEVKDLPDDEEDQTIVSKRKAHEQAKTSSLQSKVKHNLPQPDYEQFIGRVSEIKRIKELLHPKARPWVIVIDGVGGIGKSALVLEIGSRLLNSTKGFTKRERFQSIIWTSAKRNTLTADGIKPRSQTMQTLRDIYQAIAVVLNEEHISHLPIEKQTELIRRALTQQRTLLIIDNLETIDDEMILTFIRELPAPTKCIVTSRYRIDVAYAIRLSGLSQEEASDLIKQESIRRNLIMSKEEEDLLFNRTGGVPLAIVWSIAQMGYGYNVDTVLQKLGYPAEDISKYCFEQAMKYIRRKPSHILLIALSLSGKADRKFLGKATELPDLDRDDGLVELERLSIVSKQNSVFELLPLVNNYALYEILAFSVEEIESLVLRMTYITPSSEYLLRASLHVSISKSAKDKIAESIENAIIEEAQNHGDIKIYQYISDLGKIESENAISSLKWIASGGLSNVTAYQYVTDWLSEWAFVQLILMKQFKYVLDQYQNKPNWPRENCIPDISSRYATGEMIEYLQTHILKQENTEARLVWEKTIDLIRKRLKH